MYGIVEIQGQQFKVEKDQRLFVHHIKDVAEGDSLEFEKVLLLDQDGEVRVGAPTVEGAEPTALFRGVKGYLLAKK